MFCTYTAGESITDPKLGTGSDNNESAIPSGDTRSAIPRKPSGSKLARISFDDYLTTWTGIATSKAKTDMKNPCKYCCIFNFIEKKRNTAKIL